MLLISYILFGSPSLSYSSSSSGGMIGLLGWGLSVGTHCCWKDRNSLDTLEDLVHEKHTILALYSTHWRYFITNSKPFLYLGKKSSMDWITMIHTSHLSSMYWQFGASISARLCAYLHKWDAGDDNSVDQMESTVDPIPLTSVVQCLLSICTTISGNGERVDVHTE